MKKKYLILASCLVFGIAAPALAADGPYVGLQGGATFLSDATFSDRTGSFDTEYDPGFLVGGVAGYRYQNFRGEFEISYRHNEVDHGKNLVIYGYNLGDFSSNGKVRVVSTMVNGYLDLHNSSPFTPYLMVGIGAATVDVSDFGIMPDNDDTVFAYQGGAGIAYGVNQSVSLYVDYRYFATEDPELGLQSGEYESQNVVAGILFNFY